MGTKKINSLSEQQIAQFATYREKWLNIGLSTEPTDIPAAEAAVKLCYKMAGLTAPQTIICRNSPVSAASTGFEIRNHVRNPVGNLVWDRVYDQVVDPIPGMITDQVRGKIWSQVYDQVRDQVSNQVWNQVWNRVNSQIISNQVRNQIYNQIIDQVVDLDWLRFQCYGCHEAGWLAIYDYLREVCGLVKETEEITGLITLAKCCGWWIPYKDVAIIQHRPCFLNFDDEKRLHCDNGMAIKYRDGFGVWAIDGVRVSEQIVMKPNEQTVSQIREEGNAEVKRIRIERFGWNRYLTEIGAEVIDDRHNDIENTEETLVRTPDGMVILLPTCKTGRLFSLEVPSDISTCEQAQNWLHSGSLLDTIAGKTRVVGRS